MHVYAYLPVCMYVHVCATAHVWKSEDNLQKLFLLLLYESPGMSSGPQAWQQAHLGAPILFSDSFASYAFPGGTQELMSLYCMPLMMHLYHVCPHTWFIHGPQHGEMG